MHSFEVSNLLYLYKSNGCEKPKGEIKMLNPNTLQNGTEQYEKYYSDVVRKNLVQYDYRDYDGSLFTCVAKDIETCRQKRNEWLNKKLDN